MRKNSEFVSDNKAAWNASAAYHEATLDIQDCIGKLRSNKHGFFDAIGLQGKKVVQIGCNNGREALSLVRMGAKSVLGIDQSDAFLA